MAPLFLLHIILRRMAEDTRQGRHPQGEIPARRDTRKAGYPQGGRYPQGEIPARRGTRQGGQYPQGRDTRKGEIPARARYPQGRDTRKGEIPARGISTLDDESLPASDPSIRSCP